MFMLHLDAAGCAVNNQQHLNAPGTLSAVYRLFRLLSMSWDEVSRTNAEMSVIRLSVDPWPGVVWTVRSDTLCSVQAPSLRWRIHSVWTSADEACL